MMIRIESSHQVMLHSGVFVNFMFTSWPQLEEMQHHLFQHLYGSDVILPFLFSIHFLYFILLIC